jgi:Ca-activated chloride channel family protein
MKAFPITLLITCLFIVEGLFGNAGEFTILQWLPTWSNDTGWSQNHVVSLEDPWYLLLLLFIPVIELIRWRRRRYAATMRYSSTQALLDPRGRFFAKLAELPDVLRLIALCLFLIALARPQTADTEVLTGEGIDIVVALDMSQSMNAVDLARSELEEILAQDKTPKNRFEIAREILQEFITSRREDRLGLVIFGQNAFVKFPLTLDYGLILKLISPDSLILDNGEVDRRTGRCSNGCTISGSGTVIGDAIGRSYQRLRNSPAKSKVIVLVTDGNNEGGTLQPDDIVEYIANQPDADQIRIYTFLVGNNAETYRPVRVRSQWGEETKYDQIKGFPTNPELLQEIALKSGGEFYQAFDEESFRTHFADLTKTVFETQTQNKHKDIFVGYVLMGLFLLIADLLLRFTILRKFP